MDAIAKLDELIAAEAAAWDAARARPGIATEDPEWKAAADAEFAHRHANGWTYEQTWVSNFDPRKHSSLRAA